MSLFDIYVYNVFGSVCTLYVVHSFLTPIPHPGSTCSGRGEINEAGGRASTPWLHGGKVGGFPSSRSSRVSFDFFPLRTWHSVRCCQSADLIGLLRWGLQELVGNQRQDVRRRCSFLPLDLDAVAFLLLLEQPATSSTDSTRTLFFWPILHRPRGRVRSLAFRALHLSCVWCAPCTTSWGVDFPAWLWPCVLAGASLHIFNLKM